MSMWRVSDHGSKSSTDIIPLDHFDLSVGTVPETTKVA